MCMKIVTDVLVIDLFLSWLHKALSWVFLSLFKCGTCLWAKYFLNMIQTSSTFINKCFGSEYQKSITGNSRKTKQQQQTRNHKNAICSMDRGQGWREGQGQCFACLNDRASKSRRVPCHLIAGEYQFPQPSPSLLHPLCSPGIFRHQHGTRSGKRRWKAKVWSHTHETYR